MMTPKTLEIATEWHAGDVSDEGAWTELFDESECDELDAALRKAL